VARTEGRVPGFRFGGKDEGKIFYPRLTINLKLGCLHPED
jgi:hypothetical protein